MSVKALNRLLHPRHAVVIGGGVWGRAVIRQCRKIGFDGQISVIHPTADEIEGIEVVRSVAELPVAPDAAFIGVNRDATIEIVGQLAQAGAGGAVCFASGFSEAEEEAAGGTLLQQQLVDAAGEMPIIGPNCYGFVNYLDRFCLWPDQHGGTAVDTGVAIITQSSNIMINLSMQQRGLPIAYALTAGNQAQTSLSALGHAVLDDPRVTALGVHIEGIGDVAEFEALAWHAARLNKPIIALKAGRSELAQQASISHTASLAGSDAAADALFARLGVGRVNSLSEWIETLKCVHFAGRLSGRKIVSASCSGGEAGLIADTAMLIDRGLEFPPLDEAQKKGLKEALGERVALANPLDYHTYIWGDTQAMASAFTALISSACDIGVIIVDFPRLDRCDDSAWHCVIEAASIARSRTGKPVALLSSLAENMPEIRAMQCAEAGLIPLCSLNEGLVAICVAATAIPEKSEPVIAAPHLSHPCLIDEAQAKSALSQHGLDVPRHLVVEAEQGLPEHLPFDFPVVLKMTGVAHKSEHGGVRTGIQDMDALSQAMAEMAQPHYLIEEMIDGAVAELLVGVTADPAHGYMLTIGAGGVLTEIMQDSTSLLLPVTRSEIKTALDRLKMAPLLAGYRGKPGADYQTITDAILAIQDYVISHQKHCFEVEINPLIITPERAVAADALLRIGRE